MSNDPAAKDPTHVALIDKYVDVTPHTPHPRVQANGSLG